MDKHHNADLNRRGLRTMQPQSVVPHSARIPRRTASTPSSSRATGVTLGLLGVLAAGWLVVPAQVQWPVALTPPVQSDSFRRAVNRAMSAAELTQTAATEEEWQTVAQWWEEAIALMAAVTPNNSNYTLAQEKVDEYSRNLTYARQQMNRPVAVQSASTALWSTGSVKEQVIQAQGEPSRSIRYDPLCQEVLYYGNSTIELANGTVSDYRDVDGKFRVSAQPAENRLVAGNQAAWTIGSQRDDVFRIQGTPSRVDRHTLPNVEVLYYGSSSVTLVEDQVVGYNNLENNLKLSVEAIATPAEYLNQSNWKLGSSRGDVLRIQGIPTQITSDGFSCSETLVYGGSKVQFHNGSVSAYDNAAGNLRVSVD